ncbi:MAG: hypothetical protein IJ772_04995 [Bacilli bacterium]|nr:hypothetical protein [Bacilli bacterium]
MTKREIKENNKMPERKFMIYMENKKDGKRFAFHIDGWYDLKNEEEFAFNGGEHPLLFTKYEAEKWIDVKNKKNEDKENIYYIKQLSDETYRKIKGDKNND